MPKSTPLRLNANFCMGSLNTPLKIHKKTVKTPQKGVLLQFDENEFWVVFTSFFIVSAVFGAFLEQKKTGQKDPK